MTARKDYFEKARGWAVDSQLRDSRLGRIAWTVAGVATAVALFEAVALALLVPLKSVQPITLLVDRQTGYVQALDPLQPRRVGADAALTQSFLAQYVTAREGFDRATIGTDYKRVALWSSSLARSQYLALMPATNPDSPLARYQGGAVVVAHVKSVSPIAEGTALVRFDTQEQDRNGAQGPLRPWISVVRYRYSDAPMAIEDRLINPLGFQVASYRRDAEAPPPAAPAVAFDTEEPRPRVAATGSATGFVPSALSGSPQDGHIVIRDVPMNQIPLGSPLVRYRGANQQLAQATRP